MFYSKLALWLAMLFMQSTKATILIQMVSITQAAQTFTIPFTSAFSTAPAFSYYIESGSVTSTQFVVSYSPALTGISLTQLIIAFQVYKSAFQAGECINIQVLVTDENSKEVSFGLVPLNINSSTLAFSGISLSLGSYVLQTYTLAFPMVYTRIANATAMSNNQVVLSITSYPINYFVQGNIYFSYIFLTSAYTANKVAALFQGLNQTSYGYSMSYSTFAYSPTTANAFIAIKAYDSTSSPFFPLVAVKNFVSSSSGSIQNFIIGYSNMIGTGVVYSADVFMFNSSFSGCSSYQFLYYLVYFSTLPYNCLPCHPTCSTCMPASVISPSLTDGNSCLSCPYLRYLNSNNSMWGQCSCYPGLALINGQCVQCASDCLTFKVIYIQSTNQSNFLLLFSRPTINEKITIDQNLMVSVEGVAVHFSWDQQSSAIYVVSLQLDEMMACNGVPCSVLFEYAHPEMILAADGSSLTNNNYTVKVTNFINYYNALPAQLRQAFQVLGMVMMATYTSGYTSMFKVLLQLQQFIDAHKFINLTLPIVYSQLIYNLQYFKFLDLTYLIPQNIRNQITSFPPSDLDQLGSAKLIYYEQGVNYAGNIITAFISLAFVLLTNVSIYLLLRVIPLKITQLLAKKIHRRRIITVHDSFDQLIFPVFFFATTNLQYVLLHPRLFWIYAFAGISAFSVVVAPFFVALYIYHHRHSQEKVEVFQDLMQDNTMNQSVTYIYYIFNYYRKVFFGLCLTDVLPGLVQVYLLICLNTAHLAFQLYLVAAKTYKSKSKVVVRLINSLCIIAVEVLIIVYNLNWYDMQTMINIGMSCFYLSIITALLNIADAVIKLFDTVTQEVNNKQVIPAENMFKNNPVLKEFSKQFVCKLGEDLKPQDPKQVKFKQDKELMEQTFQKDEQRLSDELSARMSEADGTKSNIQQIDLVYIDDDWMDVYPIERSGRKPDRPQRKPAEKPDDNKNKTKQSNEESKAQLVQISPQIHQEEKRAGKQQNRAIKINNPTDRIAKVNSLADQQTKKKGHFSQTKKPSTRRSSKYDVEEQKFKQLPSKSSKYYSGRNNNMVLQIKPIRELKVQEQLSEVQNVTIKKK